MSEAHPPPPEARCDALYRTYFRTVLAYVRRREFSESEVVDIVADVFAVAWRRIDSVPESPGDLLWLYGWRGESCPSIASAVGVESDSMPALQSSHRSSAKRSATPCTTVCSFSFLVFAQLTRRFSGSFYGRS